MYPPKCIWTFLKMGFCFRGQIHPHYIWDSILSQDARYTEEDIIFYYIDTLNHGENWMHPSKILHYTFCRIHQSCGPGCIVFQFDHLISIVNWQHVCEPLSTVFYLYQCQSQGMGFSGRHQQCLLHTGTLASPLSTHPWQLMGKLPAFPSLGNGIGLNPDCSHFQ